MKAVSTNGNEDALRGLIKREFVWGTVAGMESKSTTRTGTVDQGLGFRDMNKILEGVLDGTFWNSGPFSEAFFFRPCRAYIAPPVYADRRVQVLLKSEQHSMVNHLFSSSMPTSYTTRYACNPMLRRLL